MRFQHAIALRLYVLEIFLKRLLLLVSQTLVVPQVVVQMLVIPGVDQVLEKELSCFLLLLYIFGLYSHDGRFIEQN